MSARVVLMGSPEFTLPTLRALAQNYQVVGVVTQPDQPAGRGRKLTPPPVKGLALELGLPVIQPQRLREPEALAQLRDWNPDLIVVAAFGQILRPEVLELPPHGAVNVHASLLPRWRGAAPIPAAILQGDRETGVTIMKMNEGLDTGPILSQRSIPIEPEDTGGSLSEKLSDLGAELLIETLPRYLSGELQPQPQDESLATYAPQLKKSDGELDLNEEAESLARRVRAFQSWPGTFFSFNGQPLKVHRAHAREEAEAQPGKRLVVEGLPALSTRKGILILDKVQPAGKNAMEGEAFLRGARGWEA